MSEGVRCYINPTNIYLLKVNNNNTIKKCEMCLKVTTKTYFISFSSASIVEFEQVNVSWKNPFHLKLLFHLFQSGSVLLFYFIAFIWSTILICEDIKSCSWSR